MRQYKKTSRCQRLCPLSSSFHPRGLLAATRSVSGAQNGAETLILLVISGNREVYGSGGRRWVVLQALVFISFFRASDSQSGAEAVRGFYETVRQ